MVSETDSSGATTTEANSDEERAPNTFFNALIGAVVSVVLGFVPFSPVLGGGVAGYLEGGDSGAGARVGAISGVLAAIPFVLGIILVSSFFFIVPEGGVFGLSIALLAVILGVVTYTVGLSVIGGVLGVYIEREV